jgi:hypothetical protein
MQAQADITDMRIDAINTLNEAVVAVHRLGFKDIQKAAIVAAGKVDQDKFKGSLINAINNNDEVAKNYVIKSLCLCTKPVIDVLNALNIPINYDILVRKGIEKGKYLRDQIAVANDPTNPDKSKAYQFVLEEIAGKVQNIRPDGLSTQNQSDEPAAHDIEREEPAQTAPNAKYISIHYYGKDVALCFSASQTKTGNKHTINLDAAKREGEDFNWKQAIHFQFTVRELNGLLAVLTNTLNAVEFKSHGVKNDKGFSIERQEGKFYLKLFSKEGGSRGVPIGYQDAVDLTYLVIDQIAKEHPGYQKPEIVALTRVVMSPLKPK